MMVNYYMNNSSIIDNSDLGNGDKIKQRNNI